MKNLTKQAGTYKLNVTLFKIDLKAYFGLQFQMQRKQTFEGFYAELSKFIDNFELENKEILDSIASQFDTLITETPEVKQLFFLGKDSLLDPFKLILNLSKARATLLEKGTDEQLLAFYNWMTVIDGSVTDLQNEITDAFNALLGSGLIEITDTPTFLSEGAMNESKLVEELKISVPVMEDNFHRLLELYTVEGSQFLANFQHSLSEMRQGLDLMEIAEKEINN